MKRPGLLALVLLAGCGQDGSGGADAAVSGIDAAPCDSQLGCWSPLADVAMGDAQEVSVVELGGKIYVLGGFDSFGAIVAHVQVFDPVSKSWSQAAPLPQPLHHANAAAVGGKIYVLGALEGINFAPVAQSWAYDPGTDEWTPRAPIPAGKERGAAAVGVIDGKIYLAGGVRGTAVADVSSYDPVLDSWDVSLPPLPGPRDHLAGEVVDGVFYAIGGRNGGVTAVLDRVDAFEPGDAAWTARAPMPTARGGCSAGVVDGKIIVVGGEGNPEREDGVFPQTERYDPIDDRWTALEPMRTPRHGMGAVGYGGKLWVPGGATRHYFAASAVNEVFEPPP